MRVRQRRAYPDYSKSAFVAVDTETTGFSPWHGDRPYAVSFCDDQGETFYLRWKVCPHTRAVLANREDLAWLREFFSQWDVPKVFHNAMFDLRMLDAVGALPSGYEGKLQFDETFFAASVYNTLEMTRELKPLTVKYCGFSREDERDLKKATVQARKLAKKAGKKIGDHWKEDMWMAPDELVRKYAVGDAERTVLLWHVQQDMLTEADSWDTYEREKRLFWVTYKMIGRGIRVDKEALDDNVIQFTRQIEEIEERIYSHAGELFNLNSNPQKVKVLFGERCEDCGEWCMPSECDGGRNRGLGLKPIEYSAKTGVPSTGSKIIEKMRDDHPIISDIMLRASIAKARTSCEEYSRLAVDSGNGWWELHPAFQQMEARTGRYSCRRPNMQNVSTDETATSVFIVQARAPFGPRPGYRWYCYDWSQQEVSIFADKSESHLPPEKQVITNWLAAGRDVHSEAADKCWGRNVEMAVRSLGQQMLNDDLTDAARALLKRFKKDPEGVAEEWLRDHGWSIVRAEKEVFNRKNARGIAKMFFFGVLYGIGIKSTAKLLRCTVGEAKAYLAEYHAAIPGLAAYNQKLKDEALANGYIVNHFGRKLAVDRDFVYRCTNYMVQGSAADQVKIGMVKVNDFLENTGLDARIVLTIHDEVVVEIKEEHCFKWLIRGVRDILAEQYFSMPIKVKIDRVKQKWSVKERIAT